jgi:hypothetical protein
MTTMIVMMTMVGTNTVLAVDSVYRVNLDASWVSIPAALLPPPSPFPVLFPVLLLTGLEIDSLKLNTSFFII